MLPMPELPAVPLVAAPPAVDEPVALPVLPALPAAEPPAADPVLDDPPAPIMAFARMKLPVLEALPVALPPAVLPLVPVADPAPPPLWRHPVTVTVPAFRPVCPAEPAPDPVVGV